MLLLSFHLDPSKFSSISLSNLYTDFSWSILTSRLEPLIKLFSIFGKPTKNISFPIAPVKSLPFFWAALKSFATLNAISSIEDETSCK